LPVVEAVHHPSLSTHRPPFIIATPAATLPLPMSSAFCIDALEDAAPASVAAPTERSEVVAPKKLIVEVAPLFEIEMSGVLFVPLDVAICQLLVAARMVVVAVTGIMMLAALITNVEALPAPNNVEVEAPNPKSAEGEVVAIPTLPANPTRKLVALEEPTTNAGFEPVLDALIENSPQGVEEDTPMKPVLLVEVAPRKVIIGDVVVPNRSVEVPK